jgi:hypothetical protein
VAHQPAAAPRAQQQTALARLDELAEELAVARVVGFGDAVEALVVRDERQR